MRTIFLLLISLISIDGFSQFRTHHVQTLTNPTQLFPSLAGWHGGLQTNVQYRNQWPSMHLPHLFYTLGADGYVHELKTGIGFNLEHEKYVGDLSPLSSNTRFEVSISPKFELNNGLVISPALSGAFSQINWNADYIPPPPTIYDPWMQTYYPPLISTINYMAFGSGIAMMYRDAFFACHVHDINQPDLSFYESTESRLPRMYSFLLGKVFTSNAFKATPSLSFHRVGEFNTLTAACNLQYKWLYLATSYRVQDRVTLGLGVEIKKAVRLSYSYDFTTSTVGTNTLTSHEAALRVLLFQGRSKKQFLSNLGIM